MGSNGSNSGFYKHINENNWKTNKIINFQKSLAGTMSTNEVNFRVMALSVQNLLGGTKCTNNNIANYNNFNNYQPPNSNSNFVFPDSDA